ncbi:secreted aspartic proteinase precursor [Truncatella angustata]|uniref:Secreted aspartic proteinase n=1 Tax=Truncatella angustata TaxID=152316 RepID=A0A9P8UPW0_9PEZI|nr:secreted aspartic proteinase precursor [Truncatella angustata]KAH6656130.1 secreted aspartic proteinase precursor [Truncatella angustata]
MPFQPEATNGSFTVDTYPNPNHAAHGPTAMYKAFLKYGKTPPPELVKTVKDYRASRKVKRVSGSATTTPEDQDEAWLTPVQIGTPAQTLNLDFDSGSSDLWVFSTSTPASESRGHTTYAPGKSSTAKLKSGYSWTISYGDGSSSSGTVYNDKVTVGGVTFASQAVEAATKVSTEFSEETNLDGLLGLAFSSINSVRPSAQKTFFDNIKSSLDQPLWTVDLRHSAPGTYNFGKIDNSLYTGEIAYATVNSREGFWTFTATSYSVGSGASGGSITGIADTGTTLALLPAAVAKAYYAKVTGATYNNAQGGYVFSCSATLPDFTFTVGGADITIPGDYINYAPLTTGSKTCFGGIQGNTGIGEVIFGDIALKSAFVVFENSGNTARIGWAKKDLN